MNNLDVYHNEEYIEIAKSIGIDLSNSNLSESEKHKLMVFLLVALRPPERNWGISDLEGLALVEGIGQDQSGDENVLQNQQDKPCVDIEEVNDDKEWVLDKIMQAAHHKGRIVYKVRFRDEDNKSKIIWQYGDQIPENIRK
ncbi:hypothetical protein ACF0H5_001221 [Mactra antiquata]